MDKKMQDAGKQKKASPATKPAGGMQAKTPSTPEAPPKAMRMSKSDSPSK